MSVIQWKNASTAVVDYKSALTCKRVMSNLSLEPKFFVHNIAKKWIVGK